MTRGTLVRRIVIGSVMGGIAVNSIINQERSELQLLMGANLLAFLLMLFHSLDRHPDQFLEIDTMALLLWGYYIVAPTYLYVQGIGGGVMSTYGDAYKDREVETWIVLAISSGTAGLCIGLYLPWGSFIAEKLPSLDGQWRKGEAYFGGVAYLIVGIGMMLLFLRKVGFTNYLESDYATSYLLESGLGYLSAGLFFVQIGILVVFMMGAKDRKYWIGILLLILLAALAFRMGRRRMVVELMCGMLIVYNYYIKQVKALPLALFGSVFLILLVAVGQARAYLGGGTDQAIYYLKHDFSSNEMQYAFADSEGMYFVLGETVKYVNGEGGFRYGTTFVEAFEILLPKVLHPSRPMATSEWFADHVDSEYAAKGGGYAFNMLAEGYLNFGILGAFLVSFAQGLGARVLVCYRRGKPGSQGRGLLYAVAVSSIFAFGRADFASILKVYVVGIGIPSLLLNLWLSRRPTT